MTQNKGNLDLMKRMNRSLVLEAIRKETSISRAGIAKKLDLSRSTVSIIIEELLSKKLVVEAGFDDSTKVGGRRGMGLKFNPKSAYGVGIDIGGTKILVVITYLDGTILFKRKVKTTQDVNQIINIIKESIVDAEIDESNIVGMGVGVPSITDVKNGIVLDAYALGWSNLPLKEILEQKFSFPIFINNDVNFGALGERWLGSGKDSDDMLFIAIGTGVGSAIISGGKLLQGHNYHAGEIAYSLTEEDVTKGDSNKSGEFGTFEKKISGKFLSQQGYQANDLFEQYISGNQPGYDTITKFILDLSIMIANSISLLNPERVVIGGGVSESMKCVLDDIRKSVDRFTPIKTRIELASLGGNAGGLGAIAYAFKEVEVSDIIKEVIR